MRSSTFDFVLLTALVAGLAYFSVDALVGSDGVNKVEALEEELAQHESALAQLEGARQALATRVDRLSGSEVDPDLLDERLRAAYGVAREDDRLLLAPARP